MALGGWVVTAEEGPGPAELPQSGPRSPRMCLGPVTDRPEGENTDGGGGARAPHLPAWLPGRSWRKQAGLHRGARISPRREAELPHFSRITRTNGKALTEKLISIMKPGFRVWNK